ncbi:MAG: DNA polymerase I [Candidatus Sungbacteria bacterium]|uniref:DNA-directed DNA polymerase n=1 Tax=Candidatus Sungiibacteriota bacterium TaxID=2750080 RepID=A0A933DSR4_9BACT|nr:DNA polymerase I [Candidatus Sungbacteria bacterium]
MKRLVLIDSHAIIHRAFHALPPLTGPAGEPVAAVYGFAAMFLKLLRELKPDYIVAVFDAPGPTFRHVAFERYKATRAKAPDALYRQIPLVKELVAAFGIPVVEQQGFEADDLIGTIALQVSKRHPGVETIIATGDLDTLQLVDRRTKVYTMRRGVTDAVLYDLAAVRERYGLVPRQLADFKGLRGDPSDNIPGVKGIGEKTASELLVRYGTIEDVYRALKQDRLSAKPGVAAALKAHEADALFSKTLATIDKNVPISFVLEFARLRKSETVQESSRAALARFGFESLLKRMAGGSAPAVPIAPAAAGVPAAAPQARVRVSRTGRLSDIRRRGAAVLLADAGGGLAAAVSEREVYEVPAAGLNDPASKRWLAKGRTYFFDAKPLVRRGLSYDPARMRDFALMWYLLEPGRRDYDPAALIAREFRGAPPPTSVHEVATRLLELAPRLEERLKREELAGVYDDLDAPLLPILAAMEERGIAFNAKPLAALSRAMGRELGRLEVQIHRVAGGPFNILSPRQLSEVLFGKLGLAEKGIRRTEKTGAYSMSEAELLKLKRLHPIIADVLAYRELAKLKSTYVDALPKLVAPDGRIHTTWNQMGTATGRLASANPNLQNIPIRSERGRAIRKAFVAAPGFLLAAFDYSQLELRIAADMAADDKMRDAFRQGIDIHRLTAAEVNNLPLEAVTPELRYRAKALNFGVLYGMGARAFAESAGISRDEAEHFIEEYFTDFQGIARFIAETKAMAHERGFTRTAFGRKRFFTDLAASSFRLQREAERMAVNHPIQGTEADIMRKAMIEVDRFIRARGLSEDVRLLLQIHDELMFEIRKERIVGVMPEIRRIMEGAWAGTVPMRVEVKQGPNWGALE